MEESRIIPSLRLERMWVNQPSTLQPDHKYSRKNVLCDPKKVSDKGYLDVYFTEGPIVSCRMHISSLSKGWLEKSN